MSQQRPARSARPAPVATVSLSQAVRQSALWALAVAAGGTLLFACARLAGDLLNNASTDPLQLTSGSARVLLVLYLLVLPARLLWLSRPLMDRAFAVAGFVATFFGLAMLAVFFYRLTVDTYEWFHATPGLVRAQNEELAAQAARIAEAKKFLDEEMAEVSRQMEQELQSAGTDAEKKKIREDYEKEIFPLKRQDFEAKIKDYQQGEQGIREDTSPPALLGHFLTSGPSNEPQDAGIYPALIGSVLLAFLTILFAVPIGVGAALYLEEYKHSGWLGRLIQVNINNLAGVPSVVYGILGAFVFVELIFKPLEHLHPAIAARNTLGGGLTLALLTLPVVIVSAQEAIRAVPVSIRHGAYALGATHWQVIWHHVLPLSLPGILTGTILSLSRAIGEAAPLVLFGALLFVNQEPSLFSRFTALPLQIFGWADRPAIVVNGEAVEIWRYNAAVASVVLLLVLLGLNAIAIFLRNRAQRGTRA